MIDTLINRVFPMTAADWTQVAEIYKHGIDTGNATLEASVPSFEKWDAEHIKNCRFVTKSDDIVTGWSALTPVSGRCVYAGVAEVSVYIHPDFRGKGIGKILLNQLITSSESAGIWTLQAGILKENEPSIRLHQSCGFRIVGIREKIGQLNKAWRDIVIMEKRSAVVGS